MISIVPDDALRARFIATASEEARICDARGDRWITYPKAAVVLDQMERILAHPRNWRMPSLLILGEAGIGKTQIDRKFARLHPPAIGRELAAPRCRLSRSRCRRASRSAFSI